jgi:spore maturation protein CgeB
MRYVIFCQSIASCWNHGNAHFLRGIARELLRRGHQVIVYEPADGWSRTNLARDHGEAALAEGARVVPDLAIRLYRNETLDVDEAIDGADVILVHEWSHPEVVTRLGERRARNGRYLLLFHDTHHRAVTTPDEIEAFDLDGYDGVLAFGEVLREVYLSRGWGRRVFTWHEAADSALFHPQPHAKELDLVWIGNWGDGERDEELRQFLLQPARRLALQARVYGVRYPERLRNELRGDGLGYGGWIPNHRVPECFARARATVHIPRRPYVAALPGIPTIRVFEALACGIPLVCAPWNDVENLFPKGCYLSASNADEMTAALRLLLHDSALAREISETGLRAISERHTCAHRVQQLERIIEEIRPHRSCSNAPQLAREALSP